jgi:predicted RNase H-like nuclease (RuvC/YqgF family)
MSASMLKHQLKEKEKAFEDYMERTQLYLNSCKLHETSKTEKIAHNIKKLLNKIKEQELDMKKLHEYYDMMREKREENVKVKKREIETLKNTIQTLEETKDE